MAKFNRRPRTDSADNTLAELARRGDKEVLGRLLSRYRPDVLALCQRILDDATLSEDAAQEAGLLAMLNIDRLRKPASFQAWLYGIAMNVCHRLLQERAHEARSLEDLPDRYTSGSGDTWARPNPEELGEAAEIRLRVRRAVRALPPGQRTATILYYLSGLTYREIAILLGTSMNAIKARLHKSRAALRKRLSDLWEAESMTQGTAERFVPMRVNDVRYGKDARPSPFLVILEEVGGTRRFPIWVGRSEATWIALSLERRELIRPGTFQFAHSLLRAGGGQLKEVHITRIGTDQTVYAEAIVEFAGKTTSVDARPSDALNLAMLVRAPIAVEASLLSERIGCEPWRRIADDRALGREYPDGPHKIIADVKPTKPKEPASGAR